MKTMVSSFGLTEAKRYWSVAATDIATGEFAVFNNNNTDVSDLAQAATSSASIPGFFPP